MCSLTIECVLAQRMIAEADKDGGGDIDGGGGDGATTATEAVAGLTVSSMEGWVECLSPAPQPESGAGGDDG